MSRQPQPLFSADRRVCGAWTSLGHPSITEIMARSGVDFVGIDLEHSTISQEQAQRIIAAAQAGGVACLPRVASHNGEQIRQVLDSGADGVIVPNVSRPEEIEQVIRWSYYPPVGQRSYGVSRAQGYGTSFDEYVTTWNAHCSLVIQIESIQAVETIDRLLVSDQVAGVMIGPYDISGSMGLPGQLDHARVTEACARVIEACRKARKACGTQLIEPSSEGMEAVFSSGYTFVVLASDVFILWKWADRMRGLIQSHRSSPARRAVARSIRS